jgi:DNA-directed RNA polymerase specialized sigma24 family protein
MTTVMKKHGTFLIRVPSFCVKAMEYSNMPKSAILDLLKKKPTDPGIYSHSGTAKEILLQLDPRQIFWIIHRTGRLPRINPTENEALEKTFEWFRSHFKEFNPSKPELDLESNLVAWIYGNLKRRLWDVRHGRNDERKNWRREVGLTSKLEEADEGTNETVDENKEIVNRIYQPRNTILENLARRELNEGISRILAQEKDALQRVLFDNRPECNAYDIVDKLYYQGERLQDIADRFGVRPGSIANFLTRTVYPMLGSTILQVYEPDNIKEVVKNDRDGILRDCFMGKMPEVNVQYLSMQFLRTFRVPPRSFADVASELVIRYNYKLSSKDLEKFWQEKGIRVLVKALRVAHGGNG